MALQQHLTESQQAAVDCVEGPLLILAGPGSGKTRVVTERIANMIRQGIPAWRILALTFTNKAAEEMRYRVQQLAPGADVWISTFHRLCSRLLRQYAPLVGLSPNFTIYDTADSRGVLRRVLEAQKFDLKTYPPERIAAEISRFKNHVSSEEDAFVMNSVWSRGAKEIHPLYQARLLAENAVDFDDLLTHMVTILRSSAEVRADLDARFRYVMVDEYQDTNISQYLLVRAISIDYPNLAVTGDPDQSIYAWRGANISNILEFEHDYPQAKVIRLEQNYRSTQRILQAADALIGHNRRRRPKKLFTHNAEGDPVQLDTYSDQGEEAYKIAERIAGQIQQGHRRPGDFAIFFRTNALTRHLEKALRELRVPFQIVSGMAFFQREEIKTVLAYLQLVNNPKNDVAFLRVVNAPARGIGESTLHKLDAFAQDRSMSMLEAAARAHEVPGLQKRSAKALLQFGKFMESLEALREQPVEEIMGHLLTHSGYRDWLLESTDPRDQDRLANVEDLLSVARMFDEQHAEQNALEAFLEDLCLRNETDDLASGQESVRLMTLHASKGLEFPVVFIMAMEEGLIPHERSRKDPAQLEEERRLLFVGMTRAREELHLSLAQYRDFRGIRKMTVASPFLLELPKEAMQMRCASTPGSLNREILMGPRRLSAADGPRGPAVGTITTAAQMLDQTAVAQSAVAQSAATPGAAVSGAAASRAGSSAAEPTAANMYVDEFHQGMVVIHPEYGLGKIIALAGSGDARKATVAFASGAGEKKIVLRYSKLRPASRK